MRKHDKPQFRDGYQTNMRDVNGEPLPTKKEKVLDREQQTALGIPAPEDILKSFKSRRTRGTPPRVTPPNVIAVRKALNMTQDDFARLIGVKTPSIRNWEQKRSTPPPMARKLFKAIENHPEILNDLIETR